MKLNYWQVVANKFRYRNEPKWISSCDYGYLHDGRWQEFSPRQKLNIKQPRFYGDLRVDLLQKLDPYHPALGVLELYQALVLGAHGWVFSPEGYFLSDSSWFGRHFEDMLPVPRILPRGRFLPGTSLTIGSEWASGGYGHFVTDSLPRLELFRRVGYRYSEIDHFLIPRPSAGSATLLLAELKLPIEKITWIDDSTCVRAERLLAPTFPGARRSYTSLVPEFLRREFVRGTFTPQRRLYVTRTGYARNPINSNEIERVLQDRGFEIYDPIKSTTSHLDFAQAAFVIGASGSGLTGLAFCCPGTAVIELVPTDHIYPYYLSLSHAAELNYGCIVCESMSFRGLDAWGPSQSDFKLEVTTLTCALDALGCE